MKYEHIVEDIKLGLMTLVVCKMRILLKLLNGINSNGNIWKH